VADDTLPGDILPGDTLPDAFWAVARRLRHGFRDALAPWDVTPSQARALGVLLTYRDLRLNELAEYLHIAARSATEVVDHLQGLGLVERHPDPIDRRATQVRLTERGTAVSVAIQDARAQAAGAFFATLSEADRADLARILQTLLTERDAGAGPGRT
jgi:DNA-binding MarR family transcriptional regulator